MKKFLAIIVVTLMALSATACIAPAPEGPTGGDDCAHEFTQTEFSYVLQTVDETEKIFTVEKCSLCGESAEVSGQIVSKHSEVSTAISNAKKGDVIYFKTGLYFNVETYDSFEGIIFYGGGEVDIDGFKFASTSGYSDITVDGFNFSATVGGGVIIGGAMNGLTVKNCNFTAATRIADDGGVSPAPKMENVTIKNCEFTNIESGSAIEPLTSIRLRNVKNLTVLDSTFDTIEYNAIQVGGEQTTGLQGAVLIKGNTFKDTTSRVIHLAYSKADSCVIEGNYFYPNEDCEEDTGRYIHCREGKFTVGVNTWAVVPEGINLNFTGIEQGNVTYDMTKQQTMN